MPKVNKVSGSRGSSNNSSIVIGLFLPALIIIAVGGIFVLTGTR